MPITGYNVYQGTSPGGEARVPVNGASLVTSPYTVTGLNNGTTYYFRVTAVNRVGEGPASAEAKAVPVTVPGAPTGLTATPGDARVTLSWTAPGVGWRLAGHRLQRLLWRPRLISRVPPRSRGAPAPP